MKKLSFLAIAAMVMIGVAFASCDSGKSVSLKKDIDSVSYVIGASYGYGLRQQSKQFPGAATHPINMEALIKGFVNAAKGDSIFLGMDMNDAGAFVNEFFQNLQALESEASNVEADNFLAQNGKQSGVFTTESGLQYKVITEGTGPRPTAEDKVKVHYILSYLNGEVVQNSDEFGGSVEFEVGRVIPGWTEGLQLMPVGSKYMFWVRQELAYGPPGSGHPQAGKFLVFEVDLLEIVKE